MIKGQARLVFTDINTGESREVFSPNFIFRDRYVNLWTAGDVLTRVVLLWRGSDVYPRHDRFRDYYVDHTFISKNESRAITGFAPSGTQLKTFYPKTSESPAYWEFYSLFLPPAETEAIACIALTSANVNDNVIEINETPSTSQISQNLYTSINLNPPCYQAPTEFLNVYYRLVMVEDEDDDVSDWVKNEFVMDIDRGNNQRFYPNDNILLYPLRISEKTGKNDFLNYYSAVSSSLASKETVHPNGLNGTLRFARKIHNFPDAVPNQYNQINDQYLKTILRGGKTRIDGINAYIHADPIVPEVGDGISGIGNVFGTSAPSESFMFDPSFFPIGSGRVFASGEWDKKVLPESYRIEIQQDGQFADQCTYRVWKYYRGDFELPLLPSLYSTIGSITNEDFFASKQLQYRQPERAHISPNIEVLKEGESFITWDSTGLVIYDVKEGKLKIFDSQSAPQLDANDIRDVKVDSNGNIWIACANTGIYKLEIDEDTTTLTHFGAFPGSQQKCYALAVDNFGAVWCVVWGQGLYFTLNAGLTWNNAGIDYPPFSDYDEGGTNSKWRFCSRIVCNPHSAAFNGIGQLMLLMRPDAPDGGTTAGCWYDQQSQTTTGITNTTLRFDLEAVRTQNKNNIVVSRYHNKWIFVNGINTSVAGNYRLRFVEFQQNSAPTLFSSADRNHTRWGCLHISECWDWESGTLKEYVNDGPHLPRDRDTPSTQIFDVETGEKVAEGIRGQSTYSTPASPVMQSLSCGFKPFGKNRVICFENWYYFPGSNQARARYIIREILSPVKHLRQWAADFLGWNGAQWVTGHLGVKNGHTTPELLERGILIEFENGPSSTTSFIKGDQYTFTCHDGFFKDNSSKLWLKDTTYFKPKQVITDFSPAEVTLIDRTSDTGLMNSPEINDDWNIDQLPDTSYVGTTVVSNGDPYYAFVEALNYFDNENGVSGQSFEEKHEAVATISGFPSLDPAKEIYGNPSMYLDGDSGYTYPASTIYSMGSGNFTLEGTFIFESVGAVSQTLFDFRVSANNQVCQLYVNEEGRLCVSSNGQTFGNTGMQLQPNTEYYIVLFRVGNLWSVSVNGIVDFSYTQSVSFPASVPFHIGKRYINTTEWSISNTTLNKSTNEIAPDGSVLTTAFVANTTNTTHNIYRTVNTQVGENTVSVHIKRGDSRYFGLQFAGRSAVFDFDVGEFSFVNSGFHSSGVEVLPNGWFRIHVTYTDSNATEREIRFGPTPMNSDSAAWSGDNETINGYVWGVQFEHDSEPSLYTDTIGGNNLIGLDSKVVAGSVRGFKGWISGVRLTRTHSRYVGNHDVPTTKFQNFGNTTEGARLRLSGSFNQGAVVSRKELVGDWSVTFSELNSDEMRTIFNERPRFAFGVSTTNKVETPVDIGYRIIQGSNNTLRNESWQDKWWTSTTQSPDTVNAPIALASNLTNVRFVKTGNHIQLYTSTNGGITYQYRRQWYDPCPLHYICFYQIQPTGVQVMPSVTIDHNGSAIFSKIGDSALATGVFHPKFLAVDCYWETDIKMQLDGVPVTKVRSNYVDPAQPLEGEVFVHQHGTVMFHPNDLGKTITGVINTLRD